MLQLPMAPLSSYFLRKSYHWTMMIAYILSVVGVWVRVIASSNFIISLLGQLIIGAMNSMTLAACSTLTALWFKPSEQTLAVSIASTSNLLGAGCGLVFAPYVSNIPELLYIQAGYTSFLAVVNLVFSRKFNQNDCTDVKTEFSKELSIIFRDWYLLALIFFISSGLAIAYALSGVIFQVLSPFGISESESGWIGFSMYVGAIVGGLFTSLIVHKSKTFIGPVRIFAVISLAGISLWAGLAYNFWGNVFGAMVSGLGLFGFMPLGIQAAVEQNKNIEESIPTNLIFLTAQGLSVAYTYPVIYFYGWFRLSGLWLCTIFAVSSFIALLILYCPRLIEKYKQPLIVPQNTMKEIPQDIENIDN
jgi:MFS family permease